MRLEKGRPVDGTHPLPLAEQLLCNVEIVRLECSLDAFNKSVLCEHVARREPTVRRERLLDRGERLPRPPLRAQDHRRRDQVADARLHLVRAAAPWKSSSRRRTAF